MLLVLTLLRFNQIPGMVDRRKIWTGTKLTDMMRVSRLWDRIRSLLTMCAAIFPVDHQKVGHIVDDVSPVYCISIDEVNL